MSSPTIGEILTIVTSIAMVALNAGIMWTKLSGVIKAHDDQAQVLAGIAKESGQIEVLAVKLANAELRTAQLTDHINKLREGLVETNTLARILYSRLSGTPPVGVPILPPK